MKKIIFTLMFLLAVTVVHAQNKDSCVYYYNFNDSTGDTNALLDDYCPNTPGRHTGTEQGTLAQTAGSDGTANDAWLYDGSTTNYVTVANSANFDQGTGISWVYLVNTTDTSTLRMVLFRAGSGGYAHVVQDNGGSKARTYANGCSGDSLYSNIISTNEWVCVAQVVNDSGDLNIYVDGVLDASGSWDESCNSNEDLLIGRHSSSIYPFKGAMDWIIAFNRTLDSTDVSELCQNGPDQFIASTGVPSITFYNMTSSGGCTNWNTNKSNACETDDTTPTVAFTTSENANCSIGLQDVNYTGMGSARKCTGGDGTTDHTCTVIPTDVLTSSQASIYISCQDEVGAMSPASTSGALAITVTDITAIEFAGDAAIEWGIGNSSIASAIVFTDQQIYVRNANNDQALGTFDKVAAFGNQRWAFNYVTANETTSSFTGMFNITPVFYVLEMSDLTADQIRDEVSTFINSTKT